MLGKTRLRHFAVRHREGDPLGWTFSIFLRPSLKLNDARNDIIFHPHDKTWVGVSWGAPKTPARTEDIYLWTDFLFTAECAEKWSQLVLMAFQLFSGQKFFRTWKMIRSRSRSVFFLFKRWPAFSGALELNESKELWAATNKSESFTPPNLVDKCYENLFLPSCKHSRPERFLKTIRSINWKALALKASFWTIFLCINREPSAFRQRRGKGKRFRFPVHIIVFFKWLNRHSVLLTLMWLLDTNVRLINVFS